MPHEQYKLPDPFWVDPNFESIEDIARRSIRKYGYKKPGEIKFKGPLRQGKRPAKLAHARAEFAYEAYKTGRYSYNYIAWWLGLRSKEKTAKNLRQKVYAMVRAHCQRNNLEVPKKSNVSIPQNPCQFGGKYQD